MVVCGVSIETSIAYATLVKHAYVFLSVESVDCPTKLRCPHGPSKKVMIRTKTGNSVAGFAAASFGQAIVISGRMARERLMPQL